MKLNKKLVYYTTMLKKVQAIRVLNKQPHEWTVTQTKTVVSLSKLIGTTPLLLPNASLVGKCGHELVPFLVNNV